MSILLNEKNISRWKVDFTYSNDNSASEYSLENSIILEIEDEHPSIDVISDNIKNFMNEHKFTNYRIFGINIY